MLLLEITVGLFALGFASLCVTVLVKALRAG
jgi:hypothetical protein